MAKNEYVAIHVRLHKNVIVDINKIVAARKAAGQEKKPAEIVRDALRLYSYLFWHMSGPMPNKKKGLARRFKQYRDREDAAQLAELEPMKSGAMRFVGGLIP